MHLRAKKVLLVDLPLPTFDQRDGPRCLSTLSIKQCASVS